MDDYRTGPETDRLQHRAFTIEDAEAVFALNSNPEVMRYTGERMLQSLDEAKQLIASAGTPESGLNCHTTSSGASPGVVMEELPGARGPRKETALFISVAINASAPVTSALRAAVVPRAFRILVCRRSPLS